MKNIKQMIYIIFIILSMMMCCTVSYAEVLYSDDTDKTELSDIVIKTEEGEYIKIERTDNVYGTNIYLKNEYNSFDLVKTNKWINSNNSNADGSTGDAATAPSTESGEGATTGDTARPVVYAVLAMMAVGLVLSVVVYDNKKKRI